MEEENRPLYAVIAGVIAGSCASAVVGNILRSNVTLPNTLKNRIVIAIGSAAISSAFYTVAANEVETTIADLADVVETFKNIFKKGTVKDEGRDTERNPEEPAA